MEINAGTFVVLSVGAIILHAQAALGHKVPAKPPLQASHSLYGVPCQSHTSSPLIDSGEVSAAATRASVNAQQQQLDLHQCAQCRQDQNSRMRVRKRAARGALFDSGSQHSMSECSPVSE
eukprot:CAMPEP_0174750102 /NCGR_PEP_ID=MMETSP1094-20130205/97034_1 /TAXON_ID=156173 /ORGANISM="Chrysochromulina brevifilum, Strain UTEX LB 985" /LENGTH=119 /DNA_ID=CAMNT_0015955401 /DNA_START=35 /DNA_END=394 /DNA_ORIENTATION=-